MNDTLKRKIIVLDPKSELKEFTTLKLRKFRGHIKNLELNVLKDLLEQYEWETKCNLDNHLDKINLIKEELKTRLNSSCS